MMNLRQAYDLRTPEVLGIRAAPRFTPAHRQITPPQQQQAGGDIKVKYPASSTSMTVTNLHSLASDANFLTGWSSGAIVNTSNLDTNIFLGVSFTTHASNRQAGFIYVYVIPALNDTPTWPAAATGTWGTEGTASFTDTEERDCFATQVKSIVVDATASAVYGFGQFALAHLFGFDLPTHFCIFVTQNCATSTNAGLAASGSTVHYTRKQEQYT